MLFMHCKTINEVILVKKNNKTKGNYRNSHKPFKVFYVYVSLCT